MTEPPGKSFVRFEPPDVSFWAFIGDISEDELRRLRAEQDTFAKALPHLFSIVDLSRTGQVSAAARKAAAEPSDIPHRGTALFGATFAIRVTAQLVMKARSLVRKNNTNQIRFFTGEQEARAWIDERRRAFLSGDFSASRARSSWIPPDPSSK